MAGISRGCRGLDISGAGKRQPPRIDTGNAPYTYIARALVSTVLFSHASARQAQTTGTRSQTSWHARSYSASIPKHARMRHHILTHTQASVMLCVAAPRAAAEVSTKKSSAGVAALRCRFPCRRTCDSNEERLLVSLLSGVAPRVGARATPTKGWHRWCSAWRLKVRPPSGLPINPVLVSLLSGVAPRVGARATPTKSLPRLNGSATHKSSVGFAAGRRRGGIGRGSGGA